MNRGASCILLVWAICGAPPFISNVKKNYKFRLIIAIFWLLLIFLFLPFGPGVVNFLFKRLGFSFVKRLLVFISLSGALLVYFPFIKRFKLDRLLPYIIVTVTLAFACAINISLRIPARTLHIPEYAILSVLLYRAFVVKYASEKSLFYTIIIGIIAGIIDERIIQYMLPMRYYDFTDILLNIAGATVGVILILTYGDAPKKRAIPPIKI